jgi:hypothetical protein
VDWNAEPNAPNPKVTVEGTTVLLEFTANSFRYPRFSEEERLELRFTGASQYRLGPTNDEGWYLGKCRFSGLAPSWGEFFEVIGDSLLEEAPKDWLSVSGAAASGRRHFLFYLRDETFECIAKSWSLGRPAELTPRR